MEFIEGGFPVQDAHFLAKGASLIIEDLSCPALHKQLIDLNGHCIMRIGYS